MSTTENIHYSNLSPLTIEKSKEYYRRFLMIEQILLSKEIFRSSHTFFIMVGRVWVILSPNILIEKSNLPETLSLSVFFNMTSAISSNLIFCIFSE